jgi:hypothetical protein
MQDLPLLPLAPRDELRELRELWEPPRIDSLDPRSGVIERLVVTMENTVVIASMIFMLVVFRRALPWRPTTTE